MKPATIVLPAVALAIAAGLYIAFQRVADDTAHAAHAPAQTSPAAMPTAPAPEDVHAAAATYRVVIRQAPAATDAPVLKARQGEQISISFLSDQPGSIEIHGYNRSVALVAGVETTLVVDATRSGRFPVHLHSPQGAHIEVTALEVQPNY
jgi:hypothetical protein